MPTQVTSKLIEWIETTLAPVCVEPALMCPCALNETCVGGCCAARVEFGCEFNSIGAGASACVSLRITLPQFPFHKRC